MKKKLVLAVDEFINDLSFVETELKYLMDEFQVVVISYDIVDPQLRNIYEDIIFLQCPPNNLTIFDVLNSVRYFLLFKGNRYEFAELVKEKKYFFHRFIRSYSYFSRAYKYFLWLNDVVQKFDISSAVFYSYWYNEKVLGSILYKMRYNNIGPIVTRAHGYDLYKDRKPYMWQPYKKYMDYYVDGTFFISDHGYEYFMKEYGYNNNLSKYNIFRLGTRNTNEIHFKNIEKKGFVIVSCSSIIRLKRLNLLIEGLALLKEEITWVHFGEGEEFDSIKQQCELMLDEKVVHYNFMGQKDKEYILTYYSENNVLCFINVSETEGIPMSIQEALSAGIPIIATDVGGNKETVIDNGILLNSNPTPNEITSAIMSLYRLDKNKMIEMKKKSYDLWKNKFDADSNSKKFVDYLVNNY